MATLAALPAELILELAAPLPPASKLALSSTARRFRALLHPLSRADRLAHLLHLERRALAAQGRTASGGPPLKSRALYHACLRCLRLRAFYHFVGASLDDLVCLGCQPPRHARTWVLQSKIAPCAHCGALAIAQAETGAALDHGCGAPGAATGEKYAAKAAAVAPQRLEFAVARLIERLDRVATKKVLRLMMDGPWRFYVYWDVDLVGDFIRAAEAGVEALDRLMAKYVVTAMAKNSRRIHIRPER